MRSLIVLMALLSLNACAGHLSQGDAALGREDYASATKHFDAALREILPTDLSNKASYDARVVVDKRRLAAWRGLLKPALDRFEELIAAGDRYRALDLARRLNTGAVMRPGPSLPDALYPEANIHRRALELALGTKGLSRLPLRESVARWLGLWTLFRTRWGPAFNQTLLANLKQEAVDRTILEMRVLAEAGELDAANSLGADISTMLGSPDLADACQQVQLIRKQLASVESLRGLESVKERASRTAHHLRRAHELQTTHPRLSERYARAATLYSADSGEYTSLPPLVYERDIRPSLEVSERRFPGVKVPVIVGKITGCPSRSEAAVRLRALLEQGAHTPGGPEPVVVDVAMSQCRLLSQEVARDKVQITESHEVERWRQEVHETIETRQVDECFRVQRCRSKVWSKEVAWGTTLHYCPRDDIYEAVECTKRPRRFRVRRTSPVKEKAWESRKLTLDRSTLRHTYDLAARFTARYRTIERSVESTGKGTAVELTYERGGAYHSRRDYAGSTSRAASGALSALLRPVFKATSELRRVAEAEAEAAFDAAETLRQSKETSVREAALAKWNARKVALLQTARAYAQAGRLDDAVEGLLEAREGFAVRLSTTDLQVIAKLVDAPDDSEAFLSGSLDEARAQAHLHRRRTSRMRGQRCEGGNKRHDSKTGAWLLMADAEGLDLEAWEAELARLIPDPTGTRKAP